MKSKNGKIIQEIGEKYKPTLERYDDRSDEKWHHPDLRGILSLEYGHIYSLNDPDISREERIKRNTKWEEDTLSVMPPLQEETVTRECYVIKGLYENDPDIKVYITKPKDSKKRKLPVLFAFGEGCMISNKYEVNAFIFDRLTTKWGCAVVYAEARSAIHTYFPKPLDDYQAAYQWMLKEAKNLGLDKDNVVLYGESGGYTVVAFAFRCKRLGFQPKGCMACEPILTDMMSYPSSKITGATWDSIDTYRTFHMCIREGDQFSPFVSPEVIPARATVEECKGLCPMYLHAMEMDSDRDSTIEFARKLYEAKVFTQLHVWAGGAHGALVGAEEDAPVKQAYETSRDAEIHDMFTYDLRRPWTTEE